MTDGPMSRAGSVNRPPPRKRVKTSAVFIEDLDGVIVDDTGRSLADEAYGR